MADDMFPADPENSAEFDEAAKRMLRAVEALTEVSVAGEEILDAWRERVDDAEASADLVDMSALLAFFAAHGIDTTWSAGGVKQEAFALDLPRIMFPHLADLERVLELFEGLARRLGDMDMVQAIHHHVGDVAEIYRGEDLLHVEQNGIKTLGGRVVDLDHTWAVEVNSIEYEHWVSALRNFDRVVPDRGPVGERMWRFTVRMPVGHAERLNAAAAAMR